MGFFKGLKRLFKKRKKKEKEPFITHQEWDELEEEDDETFFIDEFVEDD